MATNRDLVSVSELQHWVRSGKCRVVDCRFDLFDAGKGRADYLDGHVPGAVYADMDHDLSGPVTSDSGRHPLPNPDDFRRRLESWGIGNGTRVVAYDYGNGSLAVRLWWMLRFWLGHERVAVLDGGMAAWQAASAPLETAEPVYPPARFAATVDESMIATTDEIAGLVATGASINLIDARDAARYRGEHEPIDTLAGHIPGARNLPLAVSLREDGTFRSREELRSAWEEFSADREEPGPIVMCGSGVTACHLILSACLAGRSAPRLYVGSWSEWIRDPRRLIASS